jgi:pimeloyl-ACP methyl ester carboxylesterase
MSSGPSALAGPRAEELRTMLKFLAGTPAHELKNKIEELWHATLLPQAKQAGVRPEIGAFLKNRMLSNNPTGLITMASHLLSAEDKTEALANQNIPTFVVYGEEDNAWPPSTQAAMATYIGAEKFCIPGAGHNPNVEAPATTAHALTTFWNATETGGAAV